MDLLHSPLHDRHVALGAKFAEFGGWSMPLEYAGGGVLAEHAAVRDAVGLFDVSHLGKALVRGARGGGVRRLVPHQRPRPHQAGQGAVHAVLRRRRRHDRRPHRVPPQRVRGLPRAQRGEHRGRRRAAARRCARRPRGHRPAPSACRAGRAGDAERRGAHRPRPARRPRVHVVRRRQGRRSRAHRLPHRLHRRARVRADRVVRGGARRLGRTGRGRRAARHPRLRSRRPRHVAHRDGLPAARPRAVRRDQPGHGRRRLGGRLGQARVLGQGGAGAASVPRRPCRRSAACSPRAGASRVRA